MNDKHAGQTQSSMSKAELIGLRLEVQLTGSDTVYTVNCQVNKDINIPQRSIPEPRVYSM